MARPDYWRLRIKELATKVDEARALRCPEYVDELLATAVNMLEVASEQPEPRAEAASQ